jgi:anti-sigma-K factor RskA
MSDVISHDDRDALAAEYVLGTLDYGERMGATNLLEVDHGFRGTVRIWERRLGELHLMVEPVEPDPKVWERIKDKIPALAAPAAPVEDKAATKVETDAGAPPATAPADAASATPAGTAPSSEAETPASTEAPPVTAEAAPPTAPEAEPATGVTLAPDAAANLVRELEDAARLVSEAPVEPTAAPPPPLIRHDEPVAAEAERKETPRPLRRWRLLALVMSLIAVALAALIGAWRYFPEQLPPQLQASTVLDMPVVEPAPPPLPKARPTPPPTFDE